MAFGDDANDAEDAIKDMVEAIAQEIFRTPMEERKQAMEAIGRSLVDVFSTADPSPAGDTASHQGDAGALVAALNAKISARVIELDSDFDALGQIRRS